LEIDGQKIRFENHLAIRRRTDRQHSRVCQTKKPAEKCTQEKIVRSIGTVRDKTARSQTSGGDTSRIKTDGASDGEGRDKSLIRDVSKIEGYARDRTIQRGDEVESAFKRDGMTSKLDEGKSPANGTLFAASGRIETAYVTGRHI
jgi:hypothetical protein